MANRPNERGRRVQTHLFAASLSCAVLIAAAAAADHHETAPGESRIVSVGGAVTEIVYELGRDDDIVAVDTTSLYPPDVEQHPNVGYMRQLAAEPILALGPTLLLAVEDSGPPNVLDQLQAAGVRLVMVPDEPTTDGVLEKVRVVARGLGMAAEGEELAARMDAEFASVRERLSGIEDKPKVLFLLSIGNGAPMAAGRDTAADGMITLAGGRNAVDGFEGYKPLSPEAAISAAPDVVLVSYRTLGMLGGEDAVLARPEVAPTPAGKNRELVVMDGLLLLGFGPRTPQAIRDLAAALHPDVTLSDAAR